jgi:hypothetical protein
MTRKEGAYSQSGVQLGVIEKYYLFQVRPAFHGPVVESALALPCTNNSPFLTLSALFKTISTVFAIQIVNVFFVTTLSGAVFDSLHSIIEQPTSIVSLLAQSIPKVADFFINYVMLQGLGGMPTDLLRLVPLIVTQLKLRFLGKTERDRVTIIDGGNGARLWVGGWW